MASCLVQYLLLSTLFGAVFCDGLDIRVVENLIATYNKFFQDRNLTDIGLPDIGGALEPMQYRNGRFGKFDTMELLPDPKIVHRTNRYGTVYNFDVSTTMRDLIINYKFHVNIPFFGNDGNLTITVGKKSFRLGGRVLVKQDGTCSAILQDAKLDQFGDFQVKYEPDDAPFITKIYQAVLNFIHQQILTIINNAVDSEIRTPSFRENFNKYVCEEVTRNSTAEATEGL